MHRLILIPLSFWLFGCASTPVEQEAEAPPASPGQLATNPELRKAQAAGALVGKATGMERTTLYLRGKCESTLSNSQITRPCTSKL